MFCVRVIVLFVDFFFHGQSRMSSIDSGGAVQAVGRGRGSCRDGVVSDRE